MTDNGVAKCFLDIVMDVEGPLPKGDLKQAFMSKTSLAELPAPFGLAKDPKQHVKADIAVVPGNDGKYLVCKIIHLKEKAKTPVAKSLCYGQPRLIDWQGTVRRVKKCVHLICIWVASKSRAMCFVAMKMESQRKRGRLMNGILALTLSRSRDLGTTFATRCYDG